MTLNVFFDEATDDGIFALLTLETPGYEVLRVVANNEEVVSRGNTFMAYPFSITLPLNTPDQRTTATLEIANVSGEIMAEIRRLLEPPLVKIELVLISDPDTVERTIDFMRLTNVEYDALAIRGTLEPLDLFSTPAVDVVYSPVEFPGLHVV